MNILIKLTSIVALIIAPHINEGDGQPQPTAPRSTFENMPAGSSDASIQELPTGNSASASVSTLDLSTRF
ncbi:MAG: hypothetical protein IT229_12170, partial [Flavobacteriales bacterium]|nr:hypothetical protein [Flavobacteriales bacterium]